MKKSIQREVEKLSDKEVLKWINKLRGSQYFLCEEDHIFDPSRQWVDARALRQEFDGFVDDQWDDLKEEEQNEEKWNEIRSEVAKSILGIWGSNWEEKLENFLEMTDMENDKENNKYVLMLNFYSPDSMREALDYAKSDRECLEKILLDDIVFFDEFNQKEVREKINNPGYDEDSIFQAISKGIIIDRGQVETYHWIEITYQDRKFINDLKQKLNGINNLEQRYEIISDFATENQNQTNLLLNHYSDFATNHKIWNEIEESEFYLVKNFFKDNGFNLAFANSKAEALKISEEMVNYFVYDFESPEEFSQKNFFRHWENPKNKPLKVSEYLEKNLKPNDVSEFKELLEYKSPMNMFEKLEEKSNYNQMQRTRKTPNYQLLNDLLKLEIGRLSQKDIEIYSSIDIKKPTKQTLFKEYQIKDIQRSRHFETARQAKRAYWFISSAIDYDMDSDTLLNSILNRVSSDLAIKIDLDYQRRDDVDLVASAVDRLAKSEYGLDRVREWIDSCSDSIWVHSDGDISTVNKWFKVDTETHDLANGYLALQDKIIALEEIRENSEEIKPEIQEQIDDLYQEFDKLKDEVAEKYEINDPEQIEEFVNTIENGHKYIKLEVNYNKLEVNYNKLEVNQGFKVKSFAENEVDCLKQILKEDAINNTNYARIGGNFSVFEMYEPYSNLNLIGQMLVDNAADFNNYQEDSDIDNFVDAILDRKIVSFESQNFGFSPEIEKEVQKETKAKTLKMKM